MNNLGKTDMTEQEIRDDERRLVIEFLDNEVKVLKQRVDKGSCKYADEVYGSIGAAEALSQLLTKNRHRQPLDKVG